ncbi:Uncharacterized protein FKW44_015680, partial [Caligus rogercresseyi]
LLFDKIREQIWLVIFQTKKVNKNGLIDSEKMPLERDVRIRVHALLESGETPTEIYRQLGISRPTVYKVKATGIERKVGSGAKKSLDGEEVKQILMAIVVANGGYIE